MNIVENIVSHSRRRIYAIKLQQKIDRALESFVRINYTDWHGFESDEKERARENKKAASILKAARDGEGDADLIALVQETDKSREPWDLVRKDNEKAMIELAQQLPVWPWVEQIRGFGALGLAIIVAEAGDLSNYATVSRLWKRLGLAVIDGVRQGGLPKSASAEDWIAHGYSRQRRSRIWTIGDSLIKGNRDGKYRSAYLARKQYELAREPEMPPIKAHRRAQRYMEKRLLKDLWQAWRAAVVEMDQHPKAVLPPSKDSAEMPTDQPLISMAAQPSSALADPIYKKKAAA